MAASRPARAPGTANAAGNLTLDFENRLDISNESSFLPPSGYKKSR